jgi:hypothetical protein
VQWIRRVPPAVILLLGLGAFLLFAAPGLLSIDSVDQLSEARAGFYTDAHPPAMGALWSVLDAMVPGALLMLLLQSVAFLAGAYLVLARALSRRKAAFAASLVLIFPPVAMPMAFIWKDSLMAGMLLLGTGLVLSPDRRVRVASLACFVLATAVKYNAFAATLPLIVLLFEWREDESAIRRYAIASVVWLAVTLGALGINRMLTDQPMHFWHSSLAVTDIVGVINYEDTMSDAQLDRDLADTRVRIKRDIQAHAREVYETGAALKIVLGKRRFWDLPARGTVPAPEEQRDAIASAWWRMVTEHPSAYLRHRLHYFAAVLGITFRFDEQPDQAMRSMLASVGAPTTRSGIQQRWWQFDEWYWEHTPLFWPWIYVLAALVLLPLARRDRDARALLVSGLVIEATLFFLAPSADYRYSHWTIVAAIVCAILVHGRRTSRRTNASLDTARDGV